MNKTKTAVAVFNKCATAYQDKFMNVGLYHDSLDLFCDSIAREDACILELACGPGNITQYLLNRRPGLKILATDLAPNMIDLAKANNPAAEFQLMDCRDIGRLGRQYDGIVCGFCLPYLSKEEAVQLIGDASKSLAPGGVLYLSTMEDDYSKSGIQRSSSGDELYIHYHEADYLVDALEANGFEIIRQQHQEFPMDNGSKTTDLVIIAVKKL